MTLVGAAFAGGIVLAMATGIRQGVEGEARAAAIWRPRRPGRWDPTRRKS